MDRRGVLIDANLLVLLVVGRVERRLIGQHRRLKAYLPEDYDLLLRLVSRFEHMVLTPNVLTETSNLLGRGKDSFSEAFSDRLQDLVASGVEIFTPSNDAVARPEFRRLGLSDSVLLILGGQGHTILTADLHLHLAAGRCGCNAINFNHERLGSL